MNYSFLKLFHFSSQCTCRLLHLLQLFRRAQPLAGVLAFLVCATLLHFIEQLEQQTGFTAARHVTRASAGHFRRVPGPFPRMLPFVQFPQVHRAGCALLRIAPAGMLALVVRVVPLPRVLPLGKLAQQVALHRGLTFQLRAPARMLPSLERDEQVRRVFALTGMLPLLKLRVFLLFIIIIVLIALTGMLPLAWVLPFYQPVWRYRKQVWRRGTWREKSSDGFSRSCAFQYFSASFMSGESSFPPHVQGDYKRKQKLSKHSQNERYQTVILLFSGTVHGA